jgi:hypothetical protein
MQTSNSDFLKLLFGYLYGNVCDYTLKEDVLIEIYININPPPGLQI